MQLHVFDIITAACQDSWGNRRDLATFAFLPVVMAAIAGTLVLAAIGDPETVTDDPTQIPIAFVVRWAFGNLVYWIIGMALYTMFAVAWHRRILVGSEGSTIGAAFRWDQRQWRFFRHLTLLIVNLSMVLIFSVILLRLALPVVFVMAAVLIGVCLLFSRACLILPAAAIESPMTIAESAKLTNGNSWRILVAVVLPQLLVMLVTGVVFLLIYLPPAGIFETSITARFLLALVAQSVNYIGFSIGITALSLTYRQLTA